MKEDLRSYDCATWKRRLDAEEPSRNVHMFSTPPALEILHLLPVAYRVGTYIYNERSNGREPIFDMSGIQLQPPNPGPYAGAPLGGMGSGSIGRGFRGDFRRWSLNPGRYSHQTVHADCFCVRVQHGNRIEAKVLSALTPDDSSCLRSWKYDMNASCGTYYARFPFAWTVYEDPVSHVKVTVRQLSPFIPGNYSESSLPASIFDIDVENHHPGNENIEVSIMFVFQNGMNVENSKREIGCFRHEGFSVSSSSVLSATTAAEASLFENATRPSKHHSIQGIQMLQTCRFQSGKPQSSVSESSDNACESASSSVPSMCSAPNASSSSSNNGFQPVISLDQNSFAIACVADMTDTTVTMCPKFQSVHSHTAKNASNSCFGAFSSTNSELLDLEAEHAQELWKLFVQQGDIQALPQYVDAPNVQITEDDGARYSAALCLRRTIPPMKTQTTSTAAAAPTFRFALAWDYPIARFGSGLGLPRYYTRFFGKSGTCAAKIAAYALQQGDAWEGQILEWQAKTLAKMAKSHQHFAGSSEKDSSKETAYYQSQIFNELYFLVDGGTIWTDSSRGVSNQGVQTKVRSTAVVSTQPPGTDIPDDSTVFYFAENNSSSSNTSTGTSTRKTSFSKDNSTASSFMMSSLLGSTHKQENELQKGLLDDSPTTVTTADISPSLTTTDNSSTSPSVTASHLSSLVLLWEDLVHVAQHMQANNVQVQGCAGNQQIVGQFLYLEGHEYLMYNTYDVHFYASFALIVLWPELELSLQRDIADSVLKENGSLRTMMGEGCVRPRKVKNVVPHDVGSPSETPWLLPNVYNFQDVSNWKDLGTKFVLQIYRDYSFLLRKYQKQSGSEKHQEHLLHFLRDVYDVVCIVMRHEESFDLDHDGMIENSGFPDQTYDIWTATGVHAYCGGLWIVACDATVAMATLLDDERTALHYRSVAQRARSVYLEKLWNEQDGYFHYDNSTSVHCDSIMSDMLAGQWYARACNLPNMVPPEHIYKSLTTIFTWNVQAFGQKSASLHNRVLNTNTKYGDDEKNGVLRGAVNGCRPVRAVVAADPHQGATRKVVGMEVDNTCLQSREVWTGTTYALAATMLQEAHASVYQTQKNKNKNKKKHSISSKEEEQKEEKEKEEKEKEASEYSEQQQQRLYEMAFATARGIHDGGWQAYGYWFATPEGWEVSGNYRSLGYMRALAIWAMQYAVELGDPEEEEEEEEDGGMNE